MAQAVQLYLGQGDPRHPAGTAHRRWRLLKSFYRPADRADEPERATYQRHAEQMHEMMGPDLHEQVKVEVLVDLLEVIRLDAHTVREPSQSSQKRHGLGLFYWLHLANHSCWPNAFFQSSRNEQEDYATMTLLALRPLDPGDEVCISYVDGRTLLSPLHVRRRVIQQQFGFRCTCPRCCQEESASQT
ncbi:unnamed protein product, partial [Effrenium voratum]